MSFGAAGWTAGAWEPDNKLGQYWLPIRLQIRSMGRSELVLREEGRSQ